MGCEFSSSTFVLDLQILKLLGLFEAGHVQLNLWVYLFILLPPLELYLSRGAEEDLCETWSVYTLSDHFSLTRWACYYIVDMPALRGAIFDICRLGLLSCTGHRLPLSALRFSAPLGLNPICSCVCPLQWSCGISAQKCCPSACVVQIHQLLPWKTRISLWAQPFCSGHTITLWVLYCI